MTTGTSIRAAAVAVLAVAAWIVPYGATTAGTSELAVREPLMQTIVGEGDFESRSITLGRGKSLVFDFPRDIKDVLVSDPKIANAVIRSARRAYIIGNTTGTTNIIFFDADGRRMASFDIAVAGDVNVIRTAIRKLIPGADVNVEAIGDGIMLTGTVSSQAEAQQACDIASHFVGFGDFANGSGGSITGPSSGTQIVVGSGNGGSNGGGSGGTSSCKADKIVSAIIVSGRDQVMLKVTVAEMDRQVIKQLGVNLNGSLSFGTSVVSLNNANPFPVNGSLSAANSFNQYGVPLGNPAGGWSGSPVATQNSPAGITGSYKSLTANLQAMEQVGVVRTLAEPTLTAISGESAHFLVGGMFPYPLAAALGQPPSVQFQNFGVGLNFTPVVLSEGRISLHISTEVSQLDAQNSVTVAGTTVPGLDVRRADTTAEISSGGTLVMAGMLQEQTKQTISGLPGLMEVPILGTLFKSRDYVNNQTELVVLVTPYIVHARAQKDLSRPDDGFADPSDPASVLLGRLNRIYGSVNASPPPSPPHHQIGFILD